jgi:transposase InsO family protein
MLNPSFTAAASACVALIRTAAAVIPEACRSRAALVAENEFLRLQLAQYVARGAKPARLDDANRLGLVALARLFDSWRDALVVVKPETLLRWHRRAWKLLWRIKSRRSGRPPLPRNIRLLIEEMARDNPWGEDRIAAELSTKLGITVSPATVRKYLRRPRGSGGPRGDQRWSTFVRNHASTTIACDFCTAVTATFRQLYVFVVTEVGSRRILLVGVTAHPTAEWTLQQLRTAIPGDSSHRYLIHDRDSIYSAELDRSIQALGVEVLRSPPRSPQANAFCERLIGTLRRECLDHILPLGESHLRRLLLCWKDHYNRSRPHSSLGPGFPDPAPGLPVERQPHRHELPEGAEVVAFPVLGGIHHDYRLQRAA